MNQKNIILTDPTKTRKASLKISEEQRLSEIIQAAIGNWNLAADRNYMLTNVSTASVLNSNNTVREANIEEGHVLRLDIIPVGGTQ